MHKTPTHSFYGALFAFGFLFACGNSTVIGFGGGGGGGGAGGTGNATVVTTTHGPSYAGVTITGVGGALPAPSHSSAGGAHACRDLEPSASWSFDCSTPISCGDVANCGALGSLFDNNGCLRARCENDGDCLDGERCHRPSDGGPGCAPSSMNCFEQNGACECAGTDDCNGAYCVPATL